MTTAFAARSLLEFLERMVQHAVAQLRPTQRGVVLARYSVDEPTLEAIGAERGVSRQAVHQLHACELRELAEPLRAVL